MVKNAIQDKRMLVVLPMDDPAPIAYMNVFEEGDIWKKIKGCEECAQERRLECCGKCRLSSTAGCYLHLDGRGQNKPLYCVIQPTPDQGLRDCALEFECIQGSMKGRIRRLKDRLEDLSRDN